MSDLKHKKNRPKATTSYNANILPNIQRIDDFEEDELTERNIEKITKKLMEVATKTQRPVIARVHPNSFKKCKKNNKGKEEWITKLNDYNEREYTITRNYVWKDPKIGKQVLQHDQNKEGKVYPTTRIDEPQCNVTNETLEKYKDEFMNEHLDNDQKIKIKRSIDELVKKRRHHNITKRQFVNGVREILWELHQEIAINIKEKKGKGKKGRTKKELMYDNYWWIATRIDQDFCINSDGFVERHGFTNFLHNEVDDELGGIKQMEIVGGYYESPLHTEGLGMMSVNILITGGKIWEVYSPLHKPEIDEYLHKMQKRVYYVFLFLQINTINHSDILYLYLLLESRTP